jgi:hypothetical protein
MFLRKNKLLRFYQFFIVFLYIIYFNYLLSAIINYCKLTVFRLQLHSFPIDPFYCDDVNYVLVAQHGDQ